MSDDELAGAKVQILRAQPGDVVVLSAATPMDPQRLIEQLWEILPAGVRAMVLAEGWSVELIPGDEVRRLRDLAAGLLESEGEAGP